MIVCYKCGVSDGEAKLYSTFGKYICKECLDKRKTGRQGHSGMIYDPSIKEEDFFDENMAKEKIYLKLVPKSNKLFVKWFIEHYPESKGIVGR